MAPKKNPDPWGVASVQPSPAPSAPAVDPWGTPSGGVAGAPATGLPGIPEPSVDMHPSLLSRDPEPGPVANFAKGVLKSIPSTFAGVAKLANNFLPPADVDPNKYEELGATMTPDAMARLDQISHAEGTAQKVGKAAGDVAQFFVPGAPEEKVGLKAAELFPAAAKFVKPLAKIGTQAVTSGAINKAQGGTFAGGAAGGAIAGGAGELFTRAAPKLAETALGVRALDRASGRTPGQAILDETTGVSPGSIAGQARNRMSTLTSDLDSAAQQAPGPASLFDARKVAQDWADAALLRNEDSAIKKTGQIVDQVSNWSGAPGAGNVSPIPQDITPMQMLRLRRGMGDVPGSWNPATTTDFSTRAAKNVYGKLGEEVSRTVPGADAIDSRISSLFPVAQRAGAADLNAGVLQRSIGRFAKPTGALAGASVGGYSGYKEGGLPGAVVGGAAGLVLPEILSSPTTLMMGARGLASPVVQRGLLPAAGGAAASLFDRINDPHSKSFIPRRTTVDPRQFSAQ
jgi:hypothetical protein